MKGHGDGISVKVIRTRKDDIQHGYCHIVSAERLGRPAATATASWWPGGIGAARRRSRRSGIGFVDVPFDTPNLRCENGEAEPHTCIG